MSSLEKTNSLPKSLGNNIPVGLSRQQSDVNQDGKNLSRGGGTIVGVHV